MAGRKKVIAPELIEMGRRLYEETDLPVREIARRMGMTRTTLNSRIDEWHWQRRRYSSAPPLLSADAVPRVAQALPAEPPLAFAERLQRVVDGQMAVIERTLAVLGPATSAEAERTARVLATISQMVQEIVASVQGQAKPNEANDDPVPRNIDEFRIALAGRIEAFVASERAVAGGPIPGDATAAAVE
jgi:transposase-like protein